jgi:imidazolonepropionase-like amidohydrolase
MLAFGTFSTTTPYIAAMRLRIVPMLLILTLCFLAAGLCRASDLALVDAKIYPSPTEPPIENGSIVVHQGKIVAIGRASAVRIPPGATIIDCKGLTVTAGFWNSHVHILPPGLLRARDSGAAELDEQLDTMFNRWGFTTVFDIASVLDNTLALRRRIESNELRGPRILTVGEPIWTIDPIYVRDYLRENNIHIPQTETPEQAIALVRDHAAKGADGIKLFTGSVQAGGKVAALPLAIAKAAVEEAHRHGMPVFAHPQNLEGVEIAINSGVDILAHTVPDSPPWTAEFVARLKRANLALIPTLTLFDFVARGDQGTDQERDAWVDKMVAELEAYSKAGGEILFGTDIGYTDHFDTTLEFTLMAKARMTYQQILASLTTNPARRFGFSGRSGRIAHGMDADLVVLGTDPALDVKAFSNVRYVLRSGKVVFAANSPGMTR